MESNSGFTSSRVVQAAELALAALRRDGGWLTLKDVIRATGLHGSTARRALTLLVDGRQAETGWVVHGEDRWQRWRLAG